MGFIVLSEIYPLRTWANRRITNIYGSSITLSLITFFLIIYLKSLNNFIFLTSFFFTYGLYGMLDLILMMAFFNMRICIHNLFFWGTSNKNLFLIWLFLRWWCYEAPSLKTSFMNCEYPSFIRPSISLPINIIIMIL